MARRPTKDEMLLAQRWLARRLEMRLRGVIPEHPVEAGVEEEKPAPRQPRKKKPSSDRLCRTTKWREVRAEAIRFYGASCHKCGSTSDIHVDHIKPKKLHPELAYEISNLQILCRRCNFSKSFFHETDYRPESKRLLI